MPVLGLIWDGLFVVILGGVYVSCFGVFVWSFRLGCLFVNYLFGLVILWFLLLGSLFGCFLLIGFGWIFCCVVLWLILIDVWVLLYV